ncbi:hypothetical protein FK268_09400 [Tsukamurella sputi]|uniref:Uncharacterized protein n=1 Tax=Tsukamurella sputi TaxID=2591848 RepID=A0A5C5RRR1_9ACTN|nr:hypothetical protein [Tsukamurella sputi]TWS25394.1 hypothetical protein FK268_09400 [Tsukamurella sputi]
MTVVAAVTPALISGGFALRAAGRTARNAAQREVVRSDLELAAQLLPGDPQRAWLEDYARVRIRALGLYETASRKSAGEKFEISYWLFLVAVAVVTAILGGVNWQALNTGDRTLVSLMALYVAPFAIYLAVRAIRTANHRLRGTKLGGVDANTQEEISAEVRQLHERLVAQPTKEEAGELPDPERPEGGA